MKNLLAIMAIAFVPVLAIAADYGSPVPIEVRMDKAEARLDADEADIAVIKAKLGLVNAAANNGAAKAASPALVKSYVGPTGHIVNRYDDGTVSYCQNCDQPYSVVASSGVPVATFRSYSSVPMMVAADGSTVAVYNSTAHAMAAATGACVRTGSVVTTPDGSTVRSRWTPLRNALFGN